MRADVGQAQIEAVACVLMLVIAATASIKAAATVNQILVADGAVHAGALAQSAGADATAAARRALPRAMRPRSRVFARDGAVVVRMRSGDEDSPDVLASAWSRLPAR